MRTVELNTKWITLHEKKFIDTLGINCSISYYRTHKKTVKERLLQYKKGILIKRKNWGDIDKKEISKYVDELIAKEIKKENKFIK
ncbi:MAG: hypothetical protein ACFFG0_06280 [Candidatus Thorarchaeota archaeon]